MNRWAAKARQATWRRMFSFSSPLFALFLFYGFFIIGEWIFRSFAEPWTGDESLIVPAMLDNLVALGLGGVIFATAWPFLFVQIRRKLIVPRAEVGFFSPGKIVALLAVSILVLLMIGAIKGANPLSNPLLYRQAIQSGGNAYFLLFFIFSMKLFGVYFFDAVFTRTQRRRDYLVLAGAVFFSFISGFASLFAHLFLAGAIHLNIRYGKRILSAWTISFAVVLVLLTPVYNTIRMLAFAGVEVDASDVVQSASVLFENIGQVVYDRFDYFDNFVVGATVARDHASLANLLSLFVQAIPRSLYPDKPPNYSTLMTGWVYPENVDMGVTANFGFINEFILYAGELGVLLAGVFFGMLLLITFRSARLATVSNTNAVRYNLILYPYFLSFIAGYLNDFGLPTLLLNIVFYWFAVKVGALRRR